MIVIELQIYKNISTNDIFISERMNMIYLERRKIISQFLLIYLENLELK